MNTEEIEKLKKAGTIAKQVREYAKSLIEPGMLLFEIAEKIEARILELGGKPAFPVNLSINEIAAHATPSFNDTTKASGLLKVDIGVHNDGFIADTALSLDLENSEENKNLIKTAEEALESAIRTIKSNTPINEIGRAIEKTITSHNFEPIRNLSGHGIDRYNLHTGTNIPNYDNNQTNQIQEGVYAIEPFTTTGAGAVIDGKPSGIYHLENSNPVRDQQARQILEFIKEEYKTLPFAARWLHKKFGSRALLALRYIENAHILHHYPQLIEKARKKVAQAEHTIIITKGDIIITTL